MDKKCTEELCLTKWCSPEQIEQFFSNIFSQFIIYIQVLISFDLLYSCFNGFYGIFYGLS